MIFIAINVVMILDMAHKQLYMLSGYSFYATLSKLDSLDKKRRGCGSSLREAESSLRNECGFTPYDGSHMSCYWSRCCQRCV